MSEHIESSLSGETDLTYIEPQLDTLNIMDRKCSMFEGVNCPEQCDGSDCYLETNDQVARAAIYFSQEVVPSA